MSDMFHFPKFSYVGANFRVNLSLDRFSKQFENAQWWLGEEVLQRCRDVMPMQSGGLRQLSHTEDGGKKVIFPGPSARFLYGGVVMVDRITLKGPRKIPLGDNEYIFRFKEGAELIPDPSGRKLTYSNPQATDRWFDAAKAQHGEYWIAGVKKRAGGG